MAAPICDSAIHLCAVRVTRLDQLGNPAPGPNNFYVTDKPIMLTAKPQIQAGDDKTLVGGCDCIIANYRGFDKLKRFDLELQIGVMEWGLMEMMLGAPAILEPVTGNPIGLHWQNQMTCETPVQPNVCIEGWQDNWDGDHQNSTYPYIHWIFPSTHWQMSDAVLQNDFTQPALTGFSRGNPLWGTGIYGDLVEPCAPLGDVFLTATRPAAACGYQTHNLT